MMSSTQARMVIRRAKKPPKVTFSKEERRRIRLKAKGPTMREIIGGSSRTQRWLNEIRSRNDAMDSAEIARMREDFEEGTVRAPFAQEDGFANAD